MNRLKRLEPIVDLAENREKGAAQAMGASLQKLEEARKSLASLKSFRENYAALFSQSGNRGLGMRQLNEYRAFLNKINLAIAEQEKAVQRAEQDLHAKRRTWEAAHCHALGMQKITDKLRVEEARREQKREQGEQDERSGRHGQGGKSLLTGFA
jgi:flagellar protein FliJ